MKSSTPELMKFKRLQRMLHETRRGTIGLLEGLWLEVARNCPAGDIGQFSNEEIAIMCDWDGDPDEMVAALVECGWLDSCQTHRLVVHDWSEHCPKYIKGNMNSHGKKFAIAGCPEQLAKQPAIAACPEDAASKPNLTKPNPTQPNQTVELRSWDGVEEILIQVGIGRRPKVMAHLKGCGSEPFKIEQIVGVWQSRQRSFTNPLGALFERLMNEAPGLAADTGWVAPPPRDTGQRRPRDQTTEFEMQRARVVKQLRSEGKSEDDIEKAVSKIEKRLQSQ